MQYILWIICELNYNNNIFFCRNDAIMLDGQHLCASRSIRFFEVIRSTTALHEERNGLQHTVRFDEFHNIGPSML